MPATEHARYEVVEPRGARVKTVMAPYLPVVKETRTRRPAMQDDRLCHGARERRLLHIPVMTELRWVGLHLACVRDGVTWGLSSSPRRFFI